jgi:NAD(P)-dependent dehydrogenase (short-subunit alcohol dehydrogenase family)
MIAGKTVLITGAGRSIGSELVSPAGTLRPGAAGAGRGERVRALHHRAVVPRAHMPDVADRAAGRRREGRGAPGGGVR